MSSSDRKINYNLRPSKSIERKMILEVLKEICTPSMSKSYRYVGFGSSFFTDFKLFHRGLNIQDMISIESKVSSKERVKFNKPFSCIKLMMGFSTQVLPQIQWNKKSIVWLDFESQLRAHMLEDIETVSTNLLPGSVLIITLRRNFEYKSKEEFEEEFKSDVAPDFKPEDLQPAVSASTIKKMFLNKIDTVLSETYAAYSDPKQRVIFKQLFDFTYKDEAPMYTFGGVFISEDSIKSFDKYSFHKFDFVGPHDKPYDISFPIITNKEYHILNRQLPSTRSRYMKKKVIDFIPKEHKESYFNTYKFYPAYIEISDM